jgi:hypothetical protein
LSSGHQVADAVSKLGRVPVVIARDGERGGGYGSEFGGRPKCAVVADGRCRCDAGCIGSRDCVADEVDDERL